MDEIQSDEGLRVWIINHLAKKLAGRIQQREIEEELRDLASPIWDLNSPHHILP